MTVYYSDEDGRLTPEIKALMEEAAMKSVQLEFCDEISEAGIDPDAIDAEVSVTVVGGEEIRELNRDYRGKDSVTDVLSFPQFDDHDQLAEDLLADDYTTLVGDVVICYDRAVSQSEEYGTGITRELVYLFVHSILHLMGYDHEEDEDRRIMRAREEEIMAAIGVSR